MLEILPTKYRRLKLMQTRKKCHQKLSPQCNYRSMLMKKEDSIEKFKESTRNYQHFINKRIPLTHCILVDSSTVTCWVGPFVIFILGVSGLFCQFYSIFNGKSC